ncbi:MAG: hypothetical protein LBH42_03125 [Treponema sp.]|nr:hypothetical protein [Treponema sp.]
MKNFAKLAIFFSLTFAIFMLAAILLKFIYSWIDLARIVSAEDGLGEDLAEAAWIAISAALYFSILLSLGYSARAKVPISLTIISITILGFAFTAGISIGIERLEAIKPAFKPVSPIQAEPGLILTQADNSIVLLKESTETRGPRLVSIPGRPLIYQEVPLGPNNSILSLPALPFEDGTPWFIRSVGIDFSLCAGELKTRFEANFFYFAAYAFALILLLASLRFIMELSLWPMANVFLGALVFRLILSLEVFLNSGEISALINAFLAGRAPPLLITPLIFASGSVLIML